MGPHRIRGDGPEIACPYTISSLEKPAALMMRLRTAIPAGLIDAGFSSLATFVVSVYAARSLPASELGAYALFFSAFVLAAVIPTQLLLIPAEIAALGIHVPRERIRVLRNTWRYGMPVGAVGGIVACAVAWVGSDAPGPVLLALGTTAIAAATLSPLQDHARRTLHVSSASWHAAAVSALQLVMTIIGLGILAALHVPPAWRPFGALALANLGSLGASLIVSWGQLTSAPSPRYSWRFLRRTGNWLVVVELSNALAGLVSSVLVTQLAGSVALGSAEAARIVAQPVYVVMVGMSVVLSPRSMAAALERDESGAATIRRVWILVLGGGALAYASAVGVQWKGNLASVLLPQAYTVRGLVLAWILANLAFAMIQPARAELLGAKRERPLARAAAVGFGIGSLASLTAAWIGAFAKPVTFLAAGGAIWAMIRGEREAIYD